MYTIAGKKVFRKEVEEDGAIIHHDQLNPGIYVLCISNRNEVNHQKVIFE
jgi:hypothetical protein